MSDKVVISFKVDQELRDAIRKFAENENRAVSNFIESILLREKARLEGYTVTLESLDDKLDRLLDEQKEIMETTKVVAKKKTNADKNKEKNQKELQKIFELELPESLSLEVWEQWVIYQRRKGNYLTVDLAKGLLERWGEDSNEYDLDLDTLANKAMQSGWKDIVIDKNVKKAPLPYWYGAK